MSPIFAVEKEYLTKYLYIIIIIQVKYGGIMGTEKDGPRKYQIVHTRRGMTEEEFLASQYIRILADRWGVAVGDLKVRKLYFNKTHGYGFEVFT